MSCRYYLWAVVLVLSGCGSLLHRADNFEQGLSSYNNKQYEEAVDHFEAYHVQHPTHDSTLYYLFDCYRQLNKSDKQITVLEKLASRGVDDENVYLNLIYIYRQQARYRDAYNLLLRFPQLKEDFEIKYLPLTREFFAELICGAAARDIRTDPMIFCVSRGYLPLFPDGLPYQNDTLTQANLIMFLDRLLEPDYPRNFHPMKHISTKSYLYLPYMRLVDSGILQFDPYLTADERARVSTATHALEKLYKRGRFD